MGIYSELNVVNTAMDHSNSESDVSLSPSQILDRLQVLRHLQLLQRGKLQKQRLEYQETNETPSNLTEVVSQFSSSTSYHTFHSLLQSSSNISSEGTPRENGTSSAANVKEHDLIEGVTALNLSQESEFIIGSSLSSSSKASAPSRTENKESSPVKSIQNTSHSKKQIALDDMPILTPKQDFETLILEKLKNEKIPKTKSPIKDSKFPTQKKKPFLKRGEGMSRFGVRKNDLVIQNTKSLPWRQKSLEKRINHTPKKVQNNKKTKVQILAKEPAKSFPRKSENNNEVIVNKDKLSKVKLDVKDNKQNSESNETKHEETSNKPLPTLQFPTGKHPLRGTRGKTWAAVLTKEQDDFLKQLKQSDYYKNFTSPAKSIISDTSCDENLYRLRQEKERTEQNMFDLLERKASHESFNLENSFINKFLKRNLECSGESTPLIMQKCLENNPELLHLGPNFKKTRTESHHSECSCEYTDCSESASETSCSTCKAAEETDCTTSPKNKQKVSNNKDKGQSKNKPKRKESLTEKEPCHDDTVTETDIMKANMEEMNAKLIATSDLLKDRLRELEDEIETFRKENANLAKMREEIELERQKFYEEKNTFEQKFNEEKILAEYYLAEEKEKLNKQKQTYEKYVREIRGRLNKKEKDEVVNLKKEIQDLKEEIRMKDVKSTSLTARLRNQLKIMEKEKEKLQQEVEKLKKENRRIQHSNEITRRLTNVKYLEEINKKLSNMSKKTQSDMDLDNNVKYKAYEIERQSRSRKKVKPNQNVPRLRAKSVPNLKVTSRYAKYFSQRDALSHMDQNHSLIDDYHIERCSDEDIEIPKLQSYSSEESSSGDDELPSEENNLEKLYMERFQTTSPIQNEGEKNSLIEKQNDNVVSNPDPFFYRRPNENQPSKVITEVPLSSINNNNTKRTISPISILSNRSGGRLSSKEVASNSADSSHSPRNSRSPISILSNRTSYRPVTVLNQELYRERDKLMNVSPEPSTQLNRTSHSKTSLTPNEIRKPDGSKELRFPNGNVKFISADGKYSRFVYYNGDVKENFYSEGRIKYFYAETKTYHTTHADGLEILEFPDGQVEKRYKDGSSEIRLPNGSVRYHDPKNEHIREEWRFPDGTSLTISANGDQRIVFTNGQVEVHAKDHKRREFPDGTVKLVYTDGTSETRYASGRVRIKDKHGNLIMDSAPG